MKKINVKKIFFITLFFLLFLAILYKFFAVEILATFGKVNYSAQKYDKSAMYYCMATKLDRENYDYSYYCIQSLKHLPMTYNTQKEVFDMSLQKQAGAARIIANNMLNDFRKNRLDKYEPNYINKVFSYNKVIRWDKNSFPLKVYFKDDNAGLVPDYFMNAIKTAFNTWQVLTKKHISFKLIEDIAEADIIIDYNVDESELMQECIAENCILSIATTEPVFSANILKKMTIIFNAKDFNNDYLSANQVYRAALHEIGHALGLLGHSDNPEDLMYMSDKDIFYGAQNVSTRDLNTLKLLYDIAPDLTDKIIEEEKLGYEIYSPILLGARKTVNLGAYTEAVNYLKKAPKSANGWLDLASVYFEASEYEKSLRSVNNAIKYAVTNQDLYLCYYNYAILYNELGDFEYALENIKKGKNIGGVERFAELMLLESRIFINMNKLDKAQDVLEKLLAYDSSNLDTIDLLSYLYIKNGKFIKAAKLLKKAQKENPQINLKEVFPNKKFIIFLSNFV